MAYLTGDIGKEITLQKVIDLVESGETELMLTTNGGNHYDAIAIRDYLKATNKIKSIGCLGMVASAGTTVMQGVKDRWATPSSKFFIHPVQGGTYGNANDAQLLADDLTRLSNELALSYSTTTGKSIEEINNIMDEERILYADEALSLNLINRISNLENFMNKKDEQKKWFGEFANKLAQVFGFTNLILQSTAGDELDFGQDIETPEQIVVGVPCTLNGTHVLPNGTTIVVEANVVTVVTPKVEPDPMMAELQKANEELTNKLTEATAKIEELTNKATQFETLKNEFVEFKNKFSNHNPDSGAEPPVIVPAGNQEVEKRFKYSKK